MNNNFSPDRKKWQSIKSRTQAILRSTPKEGRVLSFETGEVISISNPGINNRMQSEFSLKMTGTSNASASSHISSAPKTYSASPKTRDTLVSPSRSFLPKISKYDLIQVVAVVVMVVVMFFAMTWFMDSSYAASERKPMGEFSALVENKKTRKDFKTEKELKAFIKSEEKKYLKK